MYFGEISIGIRVWFERRVRRTLEAIRDDKENKWERCRQLADPEILQWAVEWYCEHIADFIRDDPGDTFCVDDIHNHEAVSYQRGAVYDKCWDVLDMAAGAQAEVREAQRFTDLDTWLEALHAGQLEWDGPSEKDGEKLVDDRWDFQKVARHRRNHWPKRCRVCGAQFRPEPANVKSCSSCLAEIRAERKAKQRAGAS